MDYFYPYYKVDIAPELVDECCDIAVRLASKVGFTVRHDRFRAKVDGKPGVQIVGERVFFAPELLWQGVERFRADARRATEEQKGSSEPAPWGMQCGGFSIAVRDIETDEVRPATQQDLRDLIKLVNSYGLGGNYPVAPQDLPPLIRAIACFKICWENADNIRAYDYLHRSQTPFIYDMHQVMGKTFDITLCIPQTMTIDEKDLDIFLDLYPKWKEHGGMNFVVLDYAQLGITKPVTVPGCIAMTLAHYVSVNALFQAFDTGISPRLTVRAGQMTDLRHVCWAFGHPRQHLLRFLDSRVSQAFAGGVAEEYLRRSAYLETSSSAIDEHAALEKMANALAAALQGARQFAMAGSLCVDDLFSGVQFVIDVEMANYIREFIEAFDPHSDIVSIDGLYEMLVDVCEGRDQFISHPHTVAKFRNIMPSSDLLVREKLRSWMEHRKTLKDRARVEAVERIRDFQPTFHLPEDKHRALEDIYARAWKALA